MIRVPAKCLFLCTPSTGSRSTATALVEQCGGYKLYQEHHAKPHQIAACDWLEPKYAMLRNPYEFLLSKFWYWNKHQNRPKEAIFDFLAYYHGNITRARKIQFVAEFGGYEPYVERFFLYEYGLEHFFDFIGHPDVVLPRLGYNRLKPNYTLEDFVPEVKDRIDELFPEEIAVYNQVKDQYYG